MATNTRNDNGESKKKSSSSNSSSRKSPAKVVPIENAIDRKNNASNIKPTIIEKPVKRRRNRPDLANFGQEYVEPGDNTKFLEFALGAWNMPPVDLDDSQQVVERINWYFKRCIDYDMKPGVVGLANSLGVTRQTLWNWKEGVRRADAKKESVDAIKKAYGLLEELWEDYMMNGKVSPPNGIFIGKNHFDYRDVQNLVIAPQDGQEQERSVEDIKKWLEDGKTVETGFADEGQ